MIENGQRQRIGIEVHAERIKRSADRVEIKIAHPNRRHIVAPGQFRGFIVAHELEAHLFFDQVKLVVKGARSSRRGKQRQARFRVIFSRPCARPAAHHHAGQHNASRA